MAPVSTQPNAVVAAVAARDPARAEAFAERHGTEVAGTYHDLLHREDVDVIYNPLPNGLHGPWTRAALEAGKHVLCEKPLCANAAESRELFDLAEDRGLLLMEAIHYAYHPVAAFIRETCHASAEGRPSPLGVLQELEAVFTVPVPEDNIRFEAGLAGGATMDLGCYCVHVLRMASGQEPVEVSATADEDPTGIDRKMEAELRFGSGARGKLRVEMGTGVEFETVFRARGSDSQLEVTRFQAPMIGHEMTLAGGGRVKKSSLTTRPTFDFQLEAFLGLLENGAPYSPRFGGRDDAVANMDAIDRIYRAAGMEPRQPTD